MAGVWGAEGVTGIVRKTDLRRSATSKGPDDTGRRSPADPDDAEEQALDQELRELHKRYGEDGDLPDHLVELARKISDAYEKVTPGTEGDSDGSGRGDG